MTATAADVARTKAIAAYLAAHDVRVVWFDGWDTRGVDLSYGPPRMHLCHWDASTILSGEWGAISIIINGRGGANPVPGPLSQEQIPRCLSGVPTVGIVAAGRCNHAGTGGPYLLPDGTVIPVDSANRWSSGSESAWLGPGEIPTAAFMHAYDTLAAAKMDVFGIPVGHVLPSGHVISHLEWTQGSPFLRSPRKPDIGDTIHRVRRNAAAILAGAPIEEDDMFSDDDRAMLQRIDTRLGRAVGAGQTSFEGTVAAVLGTVQSLVNRDNAQDSQLRSIAAAIGDTKSAVLAGLATLPIADLQLSDQQLDTVAHAVVDDLREAGVPVTAEEILAALATKLATPVS